MNWDKISSNFNPTNGHLVGNFPLPTLDIFPLENVKFNSTLVFIFAVSYSWSAFLLFFKFTCGRDTLPNHPSQFNPQSQHTAFSS